MRSQMSIRLPFRMRVADGASFISGFDLGDVRIDFRQCNLAVTGSGWYEEALQATIVTVIADTDKYQEVSRDAIRYLFLLSLLYLNQYIDAYRISKADYNVREVVLSDLPRTVRIVVDGESFDYMIGVPDDIEVDEDSPEYMRSIGEAMATWNRWPALLTMQRFYAIARSYLEQGDYFNAIINLETTFEIQVRLTLGIIADKQNIKDPKRTKLMKAPLRNVIEEHFARYLGGGFKYLDPGPVHTWHEHLYLLRNRCIHEGHFNISLGQAYKAFDAYNEIQAYIGTKLVERGFLEPGARILIAEHAPRREVELLSDSIKERLKQKGLIPSEDGIFWKGGRYNDVIGPIQQPEYPTSDDNT